VCTHIMDYGARAIHSAPAQAAEAVASAPCPIVLHTMPNHRAMLELMVDLTFHFFVVTSMLERGSSRCVLVVGHLLLWTADNLTYDVYNARGGDGRQVMWHWVMFLLNETTQMATVLIITMALEEAQRAQIKRMVEQAELRVRTQQLEEEKERLLWEASLTAHSSRRDPPLSEVHVVDDEDGQNAEDQRIVHLLMSRVPHERPPNAQSETISWSADLRSTVSEHGDLWQAHFAQGHLMQNYIAQGHLVTQAHIAQYDFMQGHIAQGHTVQGHAAQGHTALAHLAQAQAHLAQAHAAEGHTAQGQNEQRGTQRALRQRVARSPVRR